MMSADVFTTKQNLGKHSTVQLSVLSGFTLGVFLTSDSDVESVSESEEDVDTNFLRL